MLRRIASLAPVASLAAALALPTHAMGAIAPETSRLASQHARWAGGQANAEALVNGLANGSTVMLTTRHDNVRSLAGFTPQGPMSQDEVAGALESARATLAGLGIRQPSADQIQAALIGGEIALPDGRTRLVQGAVVMRQSPLVSPVAARQASRTPGPR